MRFKEWFLRESWREVGKWKDCLKKMYLGDVELLFYPCLVTKWGQLGFVIRVLIIFVLYHLKNLNWILVVYTLYGSNILVLFFPQKKNIFWYLA